MKQLCSELPWGWDYGNLKKEKLTKLEIENYKNQYMGNKQEIIGYKAPKDLYQRKVKKDEVIPTKNKEIFNEYHVLKGSFDVYLPAEIVESWEPVYKNNDIYIGTESNGYKVKKENNTTISINGDIYTKTDLLNVKKVLELDNVKSIKVGCSGQYEIDLKKLNKIIELLNKK